jgi:hypothetical protein
MDMDNIIAALPKSILERAEETLHGIVTIEQAYFIRDRDQRLEISTYADALPVGNWQNIFVVFGN